MSELRRDRMTRHGRSLPDAVGSVRTHFSQPVQVFGRPPAHEAYALAHLMTVSSVRVVMSFPNERSSRLMNTGPFFGSGK